MAFKKLAQTLSNTFESYSGTQKLKELGLADKRNHEVAELGIGIGGMTGSVAMLAATIGTISAIGPFAVAAGLAAGAATSLGAKVTVDRIEAKKIIRKYGPRS